MREEACTRLDRFLQEGVQKVVQQLFRVFDAVRVLTEDPDHGRFRIGVLESVQVLAECANDTFVLVRVPSEDVLDDDDGFLDDVRDLGRDELKQNRDADVG